MVAAVFAMISLALGAWVLAPLFRQEDFRSGESLLSGELKDLYALKNVAYDTVRDIEFDFQMGKMAEKDYLELKSRYQGEAAAIMARLQEVEGRVKLEQSSHRAGGRRKART